MSLDGLAHGLLLPLLGLALGLALLRVIRGPSTPDRVLALDLLGSIGIGTIGVIAVVSGSSLFLDVALVIALLSFLGTVAFARYLERTGTG